MRIVLKFGLLLSLLAAPVMAANHVRVILDNSGSMKKNDSGRLAILSTLLLYDLARPTGDDTFAVLTFDERQSKWTSGVAPEVHKPWIRGMLSTRAEFAQAISAITYTASHTYYYPVFHAAFSDLPAERGTSLDRRVVILVTDGVPEDPASGLDPLRQEVAEATRQGVSVYVLALGRQASSHQGDIRSVLSVSSGDLLVDEDGKHLPDHMLAIFRRSFGYTGDAQTMPAEDVPINLEGQHSPNSSAVVMYWPRTMAPDFQLRNQGGVSAITHRPLSWSVEGGSYSLAWITAPGQRLQVSGPTHTLRSDAVGAKYLVLRPLELVIDILPPVDHPLDSAVVAGEDVAIRVKVRSKNPGATGLGVVPTLEYSFEGLAGDSYGWAPATGPAGSPRPEGAAEVWDFSVRFPPEHPFEANKGFYAAYITVETKSGLATVGRTTSKQFQVYPPLQIQPAGGNRQFLSLRRDQQGCITFSLTVTKGRLPPAEDGRYPVRASIEQLAGELSGAQFLLDDRPVFAPHSKIPSEWSAGRWLSASDLGASGLEKTHKLCMVVGRTAKTPNEPMDLSLKMELAYPPYDHSQAVSPLGISLTVAPPTWRERYESWLGAGLGALILLAQLWYQRYRPQVPGNLQSAYGDFAVAGHDLPDGPVLHRTLGLSVPRPVVTDNGSYTVGWVRPLHDDLYEFRPAEGVTLQGSGQAPDGEADRAVISVKRNYTVSTPRGEYSIRVEFP